MPNDDESKILPPMMSDKQRPQVNRALLGVLLALLFVAVVFALWFLIVDDDDSATGNSDQRATPTPLTLPTSTAIPVSDQGTAPTPAPTTAPLSTPTPVPEGFETCSEDRSPLTSSTYVVDTNTTPLNQRSEPSVNSEQAGTFDPGQADLVFTGECVVNIGDGYVWWKIFNGTTDVWVASNFVTPN